MNWDAFNNRAQTNGKRRVPRRHRHAVELTATCACALLVTLSLVLPAFAAGASNDAQTESTTVAATTDNPSSSSSNENVSGGGTSQDGSASSSVEKDESTSDESSSAGDSDSSSTAAAAKAAPLLAAANSATQVSGNEGLSAAKNGGTFQLSGDVYQTSTVTITGNTTVDLNGHSVYYKGTTSLFDVEGGTLTIIDSNPAKDTKSVAESGSENVGSITYNGTAPTKLTYYVTESTVNDDGIGTTETRYQHTVTPGGVITAEANNGANSVIYMKSGTLNIEGGTICMPHSASHGSDCHIINVAGGTFNLSGGYIAGGKRTSNWGGGVCLTGSAVLNMSGGVITANEAKAGAGVYAAQGTTVNMSNDNAVISGNTVVAATYSWDDGNVSGGYGGGVFALGATVNVSGGYITNNRVKASYKDRHQGLIGGGGIAIMKDSSQASLTISGGYITENYSNEAGGGIYAGRWGKGLGENFSLTGGTIASNVAQNSEGGGIRISAGTTANFDVTSGSHAYITNNFCNSHDDWGGGGVFVQKYGSLYVKNSLVTDNTSGGYGAGVAACPTGETVVTHTSGAAIYRNTDDVDGPHFSTANEYGKHEDYDVASFDNAFTSNGHADYFLVRDKPKDMNSASYVTVVTGRMLGGGASGWSGSVDGKAITKVDVDSGIEAKYIVGMTANPTESAKKDAKDAATLIFSGNYAYNHGGGIMTNGGLTIGEKKDINIYPGLKFNAKKALTQDNLDASGQLAAGAYHFVLLSSESNSQKPTWDNGTLSYGGCTEVTNVANDAEGNISFTASSQYSSSGTYRYYVVEMPNKTDKDTKTQSYDRTIYQIDAKVELSSSPKLLNITFNHYTIKSLMVTAIAEDGSTSNYVPESKTDLSDNSVSFTLTKDNKGTAAFTNTLKPYSTSGTFTPEVKKHVEGGEVKSWQFELYDEKGFADGKWTGTALQTKSTTKSDSSDATVTFDTINYTNIGVNDLTGGKGGTKTYTYYIREKSGSDNGYTYDGGYYKVVVTATDTPASDKFSGTLTTTAKYTYVDANGKSTDVADGDKPTFNNKYATSLPSAGQAGIALAYVAGAAALAYGIVRLYKTRSDSRKGGDR
jgi:hypothetical protein